MDANAVEPEMITVVEGPTPEFHPAPEVWALALCDSPHGSMPVRSRMRTFDGPKMINRCTRAWAEGRPVLLDFPDHVGLRRQAQVIAARWEEVEEGHVLHLWVREG